MLEKLPGVASADADKTTSSATVVYDKSVFDVNSIGNEGRYKFELREDSAASAEASEGEASDEQASMSKEETEETGQASDSSKIQIRDMPAGDDEGGSGTKGDGSIMPSLDGPAS